MSAAAKPATPAGAPPKVTAVVVSSGNFEATVRSDRGIEIVKVGPQGGRTRVLELSASQATLLLELIESGRETLRRMQT